MDAQAIKFEKLRLVRLAFHRIRQRQLIRMTYYSPSLILVGFLCRQAVQLILGYYHFLGYYHSRIGAKLVIEQGYSIVKSKDLDLIVKE